MPRSLDLNRLKQFEDKAPTTSKAETTPETVLARWPSREPIRDGQISIKAPVDILARFKQLCKDDRRTYADMLSILMDHFEKQK